MSEPTLPERFQAQSRRPRILLLSGYDAGSHRRWREQLVNSQPAFDWHVLKLPPRYFRWRIRGNALSWLDEPRLKESWDLIVATSMVDLAGLRAFHRHLATVPVLLYMHENQFAYPDSGDQHASVDHQMVNLYSALAADQVAFNSAWNRVSFLQGIRALLNRLPDAVPEGVTERIECKSSVLPVPIDDALSASREHPINRDCPHLLWNHRWECESVGRPVRILWAARWEYDKGPDRLYAILKELEYRNVDFRLCVLGEKFRRKPEAFDLIARDFSHRIDQFGYAKSRDEYYQWLRAADLILSTATHEFQGLAVLEAVASGCIPIVPDRVVYPELFPQRFVYPDCGNDLPCEAKGAVSLIEEHCQLLVAGRFEVPDVEHFSLGVLQPKYEALLRAMLEWH